MITPYLTPTTARLQPARTLGSKTTIVDSNLLTIVDTEKLPLPEMHGFAYSQPVKQAGTTFVTAAANRRKHLNEFTFLFTGLIPNIKTSTRFLRAVRGWVERQDYLTNVQLNHT